MKPTAKPIIPTLLAEPTGNSTQVKVWCPFCRPWRSAKLGMWHYHGSGSGPGPNLGHRGAHCLTVSGSPFLATGYNLRLRDEGVEDRG